MGGGRFGGKVVLISGAASGFGARAAERFGEEGAHLVLTDRNAGGLAKTLAKARGASVEAMSLDGDVAVEATHAALAEMALKTFGRLDIAINNAGVAQGFQRIEATPTEVMRQQLDVNVLGVFLAMKHQVPAMLKGGGGVIVNVASVAGLVGCPMIAAYCAAKHAVIGLTKSVAGEVARKNIRVNALCPAFAATPMVTGVIDVMPGGPQEAAARVVANMPMRRLGEVDEVVQAMLFLCSPENSFMTGHSLAVDGGLSAV